MKMHLVDDGCPEESIRTIKTACQLRNIDVQVYESVSFIFEPSAKAMPGDLLFRPAISAAAQRVEQYLYQPGVATFYQGPLGIFYNSNNAAFLFEQHNIPIPRTFYLHNTNRELLNFYVEQLGGYPVILKVLGHSGGFGVMRLDSAESLFSVVDYVCVDGTTPILCAYIPNAVHWRCVVVGEKVVAAYINPTEENDFRSYGTTNKDEVFDKVDPDMAMLAVNAVKVLGNEFGGVDILQHESGRNYVLEANFPCYYAHAQEVGEIDVAGKIVDYLVEKSKQPHLC